MKTLIDDITTFGRRIVRGILNEFMDKPKPKKVKRKASPAQQKYRESIRVKVAKYSMDGKLIKKYNSIIDAVHDTPTIKNNGTNITACAKGHRKSAGGFIWRYINE